MTQQLHTLLALRDSVKSRKTQQLTETHRLSTKHDLYEGLTRSYRPRDEDGDQLPPENKNVQVNADTMLNQLVQVLSRDWDMMASIDTTNQQATADVKVPTGATTPAGEPVYRTILRDVPATYLLFLARELDDVYTFVSKLPLLDPSERWSYDANVMAYVTEPVQTHRTKKIRRNHVKAPATDRHQADVEVFTEDVVVGDWALVRRSGALPLERKAQLLQRVDELRLAVREARERANQTPVTNVTVSRQVFDHLFGSES